MAKSWNNSRWYWISPRELDHEQGKRVFKNIKRNHSRIIAESNSNTAPAFGPVLFLCNLVGRDGRDSMRWTGNCTPKQGNVDHLTVGLRKDELFMAMTLDKLKKMLAVGSIDQDDYKECLRKRKEPSGRCRTSTPLRRRCSPQVLRMVRKHREEAYS